MDITELQAIALQEQEQQKSIFGLVRVPLFVVRKQH
jgi:hypothetical protein